MIILARHGESEYSARGLCNGDPSIAVPLTSRGRDEAQRLGEGLRDTPLGLCVTSVFQRTRETAAEALRGRDVPQLVMPDLNDPLVGRFEGATIDEYRDWASSSDSSASPEPGGESRVALVERYAHGFRMLLDRPEPAILVVIHSLPISYALEARAGRAPTVRVPLVEHAAPFSFTGEELGKAVALLEEWAASPTW